MPRQVRFFIVAVVAACLPAIVFVHLSCDTALQTYALDIDGVHGIPLERLLWRQGVYPITGVFAGGAYYDWADEAYRSQWYIPALITSGGRLIVSGRSSDDGVAAVITVPRPELSILDVAPTAGGALGLKGDFDGRCVYPANATQVVVIYVDALGWQRYEWGRPAMSNLSALGPAPAIDVYPSISVVNAAALVTGVMPERSGVDRWERRTMRTGVDNVIDLAARHGVSAAWIDGPRPPVTTATGIISLEDADGDGTTDDEVTARAMAEYEAGTRLLYVHLRGPDRALHASGPYSNRSLAALAQADAQIGTMVRSLKPGTLLIITADHGGHDIAGGKGEHGTLLPEDMIIPFIARAC
ncbi:MAG: Type I phosphodiesterase / nucleotide pyrophosphatase [Methanocella sp. PtaU1.Bin125]|nr:MAG: Type I phosphodiesterase / nucleotide pyrophosphatase [Methanocella sp. PtaU1.Bin125]